MGKAPSKRKKKRKRSPDRGARAPRKIATEDDVRNIRRMADGIQAARERDPRRYPNPSWEYVRDLYGFGRCTISAILNGTFVPTETRAPFKLFALNNGVFPINLGPKCFLP